MNTVKIEMSLSDAVIVEAILKEKKRAEEKHPAFVANLSDGALVIAEESGEVADAVLKYFYEGGDYRDITKELTHVAATALRMLEYIQNSTPQPRVKIK